MLSEDAHVTSSDAPHGRVLTSAVMRLTADSPAARPNLLDYVSSFYAPAQELDVERLHGRFDLLEKICLGAHNSVRASMVVMLVHRAIMPSAADVQRRGLTVVSCR